MILKHETTAKRIQVYRAGAYVIAHVFRYDAPVEAYRVYKVLGDTIGATTTVHEGRRVFNVADVANADKVVKIGFGNFEIRGVELVTNEAEILEAIKPIGSEEVIANGKFSGRTFRYVLRREGK